jgi:hypothetical protein
MKTTWNKQQWTDFALGVVLTSIVFTEVYFLIIMFH